MSVVLVRLVQEENWKRLGFVGSCGDECLYVVLVLREGQWSCWKPGRRKKRTGRKVKFCG